MGQEEGWAGEGWAQAGAGPWGAEVLSTDLPEHLAVLLHLICRVKETDAM